MQQKLVTGGALSGQLGGQLCLRESGKAQEGDVISFGVKTLKVVHTSEMPLVASIASTTSLTIGSTAGLSGAAIAGTIIPLYHKNLHFS